MDPKQNLKPELKEIYEKIMQTSTKSPVFNPVAQPTNPSVNPTHSSQVKSTQITNTLSQVNPAILPAQSQNEDTTNMLSSVAPKPINNTKSFVFSSKNPLPPVVKEAEKEKEVEKPVAPSTNAVVTKKSPLSPIIILLNFVFIVIYALFWLILFGIIDKSKFGM